MTGATGFLGSALCGRLAEDGAVIRPMSRRVTCIAGESTWVADLSDCSALRRFVAGADIVVHLAAKVDLWGPRHEFLEVNVRGTQNLLDACAAEGTPAFVHASSPSVVHTGDHLSGVDERTPLSFHQRSNYARTKAHAELAVAREQRFRTVILRPHLVWGPGDTHFIPRLVTRARSGRLARIGSYDPLISPTYIDDAVDAHVLAACRLVEGSIPSGRVYFITGPEVVGLWATLGRLLDALEMPFRLRSVPKRAAFLAALLAEATAVLSHVEPALTRLLVEEMTVDHWFDISAARRDLGFDPTVSIGLGVERLASWLSSSSPEWE